MKIIKNSSLHLSHLIEDALDMSRIENDKFEINLEEFSIREIANEIYDIMEFPVRAKGLTLNMNIDDSVPEKIKSDPKRYKQVLFNLIGNAVKFTFSGSITA